MESTYLYYPARKVYKILSSTGVPQAGYKVVFCDADEMSLILRRQFLFIRKKFFEVKIEFSKENISRVEVNQIYCNGPDIDAEKKVVQMILKMF